MEQRGQSGEDAVKFSVARQEKYSRLLALCTLLFFVPKSIILIPHLIILWALGVASFVVVLIAQVAVLFTASYPRGLHEFVVNVNRWQLRVSMYASGLTDQYPPFRLK